MMTSHRGCHDVILLLGQSPTSRLDTMSAVWNKLPTLDNSTEPSCQHKTVARSSHPEHSRRTPTLNGSTIDWTHHSGRGNVASRAGHNRAVTARCRRAVEEPSTSWRGAVAPASHGCRRSVAGLSRVCRGSVVEPSQSCCDAAKRVWRRSRI